MRLSERSRHSWLNRFGLPATTVVAATAWDPLEPGRPRAVASNARCRAVLTVPLAIPCGQGMGRAALGARNEGAQRRDAAATGAAGPRVAGEVSDAASTVGHRLDDVAVSHDSAVTHVHEVWPHRNWCGRQEPTCPRRQTCRRDCASPAAWPVGMAIGSCGDLAGVRHMACGDVVSDRDGSGSTSLRVAFGRRAEGGGHRHDRFGRRWPPACAPRPAGPIRPTLAVNRRTWLVACRSRREDHGTRLRG
jgi:hypothetical protein